MFSFRSVTGFSRDFLFLRGLSTSIKTSPDALVAIPITAAFSSEFLSASDVFCSIGTSLVLNGNDSKNSEVFCYEYFSLSMFCRFTGHSDELRMNSAAMLAGPGR